MAAIETKIDVDYFPGSTSGDSTVDVVRLARILVDYRWTILLAMLIAMAVSVTLSFLAPPAFLSTATIDASAAGKDFVSKHEPELFWETEQPVLDVAARNRINLENVKLNANIRYTDIAEGLGRVEIEVVASKSKVSERMARVLAEHFMEGAEKITKESGEREKALAHYKEGVNDRRRQIKVIAARWRTLKQDIGFLEDRVSKLDPASRDGLAGSILRMELMQARNMLYGLDGSLDGAKQSLRVWELEEEEKRKNALKQFEITGISESLEIKKRTVFNSIIAGFIGLMIAISFLYYREVRARINVPG